MNRSTAAVVVAIVLISLHPAATIAREQGAHGFVAPGPASRFDGFR